ncbi:MAG: FAD-binding protein [Planctomycetes bacterium]|nr:FAD-binding protein [Planctomycetota bacterium]
MTTVAPLQNFGENVTIRPTAYYEPKDEAEVVEILNRHRGEQIRAVGRLHSWSTAPGGEGVVLSLKHLQDVTLHQRDGTEWATIAAGCQVKTILQKLKEQGKTLPSLGLITEQTIAGAISTGTHGSGRNSLSHYVRAVRVARYDPASGIAMIETIESGTALQAARCSLGCLGIILSVDMQVRYTYAVEEHFREYDSVEPVLQAEAEYPLQQFYLSPWRWKFLVQHRREVSKRRSRLAWLYRIHWFLSVDLGLHLLILTTLRLRRSNRVIRFLFRRVIPHTVPRNLKVTDDSSKMLIMEHELFRHMEMELFVPRDQLPAALEYVQQVLIVAGSATSDIPDLNLDAPSVERLTALRGLYGHHYPICVRRVCVDDTLISMSSGGEQDWYAISLISYAKPRDRQGFLQAMDFLATTMKRKFGARPHWGKYCPLSAEELIELYPRFGAFREICEMRDPTGVFRNNWIRTLIPPT